MNESRAWDEGQHPARSLGLSTDRLKEPETPPAERALRTAPVRKEPPAAREQGPRAQCKNPEGCLVSRDGFGSPISRQPAHLHTPG